MGYNVENLNKFTHSLGCNMKWEVRETSSGSYQYVSPLYPAKGVMLMAQIVEDALRSVNDNAKPVKIVASRSSEIKLRLLMDPATDFDKNIQDYLIKNSLLSGKKEKPDLSNFLPLGVSTASPSEEKQPDYSNFTALLPKLEITEEEEVVGPSVYLHLPKKA